MAFKMTEHAFLAQIRRDYSWLRGRGYFGHEWEEKIFAATDGFAATRQTLDPKYRDAAIREMHKIRHLCGDGAEGDVAIFERSYAARVIAHPELFAPNEVAEAKLRLGAFRPKKTAA